MAARSALLVFGLLLFVAACGGSTSSRTFVMLGESMQPTLSDGDEVAVEGYGGGDPQRGDIIVFHPPTEPGEPSDRSFLKRVIALPGETVEIREEAVLINGSPIAEPYTYESTAGTFGPYVVPEDAYFVMGDNRNNSSDSRSFDAVPRDNIEGRAMLDR